MWYRFGGFANPVDQRALRIVTEMKRRVRPRVRDWMPVPVSV
jgi:hypothetical protein